MATTRYKWSIEKWHELVDSGVLEGQQVELLEGELVEMSPEGIPHRNTSHKIVKYLRKLLEDRAEVYEAHPITLDNSEPEPDVSIVRLPESTYDLHHPYAEDIYWLIEIANRTLAKDLSQKTVIYARNGISEYWVIDLVNKKLIVHTQPSQDNYLQVVEYKSETIAPQAFPEITISLDSLLL
ncbi:MAG: Uma2 family endonuclease [Pleurocapsa minor HA4230-MV1]|jgi:Uma2 family endonuclease|nr:Uma2 family endonuclease [Pleurocapsa minor HA4230-MV1]